MIEKPQPGSVAYRAQCVLVANGRAPNLVRALNDEEREALAALWQDGTPAADGKRATHGSFAEGSAEKYRAILVKFGERIEKEKATVDEAEGLSGLQANPEAVETLAQQPPAGRE